MENLCILVTTLSISVHLKYSLFTFYLIYSIVLQKQSAITLMIVCGFILQEFYSLGHPLLFCVFILTTLRANLTALFVILLFILVGAN